MNKLTQEMIDAGATALCGLTRAQAKDDLTMKRFKDGCEKAQWLWTLMTAAAPKGSNDEPTLRDDFAGQALAAMIGQPSKDGANCGAGGVKNLVAFAYEYADAMLVERSK